MDGITQQYPVTYVTDLETAHELAITEAPFREEIKSLTTLVQNLRDTNRVLAYGQIDGDDDRLTSFWEKAQRIADAADYCEVFDRMAEALGGPRRTREFTVSVTVTYQTTVEARDADDAIEIAHSSYAYGEMNEIADEWEADEA